jgi:hypothetical protein
MISGERAAPQWRSRISNSNSAQNPHPALRATLSRKSGRRVFRNWAAAALADAGIAERIDALVAKLRYG